MKALLVDDERLARLDLRHVLSEHSDVEIIGEAANITEAEAQIQDLKPDVVFLDIRMPDGSGFDLLERLNNSPIVVFTTAYDEYALKAFEVNALDYLLKPIEKDRLAEALERVRGELRSQVVATIIPDTQSPQSPLQADSRVFLRDGDKCLFVRVADILTLKVEGRYVEALCRVGQRTEKLLLQRSLESLEERLPEELFFRANRNVVLNLHAVDSIEAWFNGGLVATLETGEKIEISRRQAQRFREMLSL
jgi:two-component system LytT family response regulator